VEGLDATSEMFPGKIPDLYDGEPVVVAVKSSTLPGSLTIKGSIGSIPWTTTVTVTDRPEREGLSIYWARQKIATLMDQRKHGQDDSALRQTVLDVALTHHLVSRYTSLVAVDQEPVRPTNKAFVTHAMKTNLPEGQNYQAIFGLPKTATSGPLQLLLGLAALTFSALVWGYRRQVA
jgi:Ca-activated chloride channel family protein